LQNLILFLISQNVFFNYFLNLKRPQSRIQCGSVGLSILECACAKTFFLGVRESLRESLFRDQRIPRRSENSNEKPNQMTIRPVRNKITGDRFLIINESQRLPIGIASMCCDTRISGFQIKCTECRELYPVRQLNEGGYCESCVTADIESCNA